jgi:predicted DNA-binding transcriptional regulator AlpA
MPRRAEIAAQLPIVFGLDRLQAAAAIGVSATTFDGLVREGRMPRPRQLGSRRIWDVDEIRAAFKVLPRDGEDQEDETWADVG